MNQYTFLNDKDFSEGRNYLGASDALTLSGRNPYQTPAELWRVLTGRDEAFKGNNRSDAGHRQEPLILGEFIANSTGNKKLYNDFVISRMKEQHEFNDYKSYTEFVFPGSEKIMAHPDLLDLSGNLGKPEVLIQAKNRGVFAAKRKDDPNFGYDPEDFSSNGIPLCDYFQEQVEMMCSGVPTAYVAVQVEGWDNRLYGPIAYSKNTSESLLALYLRMIWHIEKDVPPTPQTWGDVVNMFPDFKKNTKAVVSGDVELECREMLESHSKINKQIKKLEHKKEDIKNALGLYLGGNHYLETPDGNSLCSAAEIAGKTSISVKNLKEHPEIYKSCEDEGLINKGDPYRQLYIKGVAAGAIDTYTLLTTEDGEKWKKSRKKYTSDEKKFVSNLFKVQKIDCKWSKV